ncbi:hypothetical protein OSTOST_01837 [Ostertagia ostertagi]
MVRNQRQQKSEEASPDVVTPVKEDSDCEDSTDKWPEEKRSEEWVVYRNDDTSDTNSDASFKLSDDPVKDHLLMDYFKTLSLTPGKVPH